MDLTSHWKPSWLESTDLEQRFTALAARVEKDAGVGFSMKTAGEDVLITRKGQLAPCLKITTADRNFVLGYADMNKTAYAIDVRRDLDDGFYQSLEGALREQAAPLGLEPAFAMAAVEASVRPVRTEYQRLEERFGDDYERRFAASRAPSRAPG